MNSTLRLSTKRNAQHNTVLGDYFVSPPFKIVTLPAYDDPWQNGLNAMQMSSSPGLLAGDRLNIDIRLAQGTALSLNTQAFTRVQAMHEGQFAEQITQICLEPESRLFYLPHPLVLHEGSSFKQKTVIEMSERSELIYGEIVAIGRVLNGERFAFRQFSSHLKIYQQNRPLVSDCIQWLPSQMNLTALSQMEEYSHQGSLTYLHLAKTPLALKTMLDQLREQWSEQPEMLIGSSLLNEGGFMIRVLAHRAEHIQHFFEQIGKQLKQMGTLSDFSTQSKHK